MLSQKNMSLLETVGLQFEMKSMLNQDQARILMVDCANEFLNNFNECEEIRPFLKRYPLKADNLSIIIHFKSHVLDNKC